MWDWREQVRVGAEAGDALGDNPISRCLAWICPLQNEHQELYKMQNEGIAVWIPRTDEQRLMLAGCGDATLPTAGSGGVKYRASLKWEAEGGSNILLTKLFSREAKSYQAGTESQLLHSCICEHFKTFEQVSSCYWKKKKMVA